MSTPSKSIKAADQFDVLVIGGGVGGLLAARALEGAGRRVALVEGLDALGGNCRPVQSASFGALDHGLKHFPAIEGAEDVLRWTESIVGLPFAMETVEAPAITYDAGRFQPFVGFGDASILAADEIAHYAAPRYFRLGATPKDWVPALAQAFAGALFTQNYVTKILVENGRVSEVWLNGAKRLAADHVLFCAPPPSLIGLVTSETGSAAPPARMRQRLSKGDVFTSIHLDLVHELTNGAPVTESAAPHVLKGANEEPCVGLFYPPQEAGDGRTVQRSQWMTFIPADQTDDSELIASQLKYIKRQIKRAYETSLEKLAYERILICPQSHGSATGFLGEDRLWPKAKNLRPVSSFFSANRGLIGLLEECRRVTNLVASAATSEAAPPREPELQL